jgi:phenylpyruvate tautomerase PptA (4-oxalocrotonate tautomerase family)
VTTLLDAVHRAAVKTLHVPVRDRYQIYRAHPKGFLVIQDTGLNIPRTDKALIVTVVSKERDEILKRRLYKELTEQLASSVSIAPSDVVVAIIENSAADWSFGNGEPQFLTGELGRGVRSSFECAAAGGNALDEPDGSSLQKLLDVRRHRLGES